MRAKGRFVLQYIGSSTMWAGSMRIGGCSWNFLSPTTSIRGCFQPEMGTGHWSGEGMSTNAALLLSVQYVWNGPKRQRMLFWHWPRSSCRSWAEKLHFALVGVNERILIWFDLLLCKLMLGKKDCTWHLAGFVEMVIFRAAIATSECSELEISQLLE